MPKKRVKFHGAFSDRKDAAAIARKVGGKVKRIKVRGSTRHAVMTRQGG